MKTGIAVLLSVCGIGLTISACTYETTKNYKENNTTNILNASAEDLPNQENYIYHMGGFYFFDNTHTYEEMAQDYENNEEIIYLAIEEADMFRYAITDYINNNNFKYLIEYEEIFMLNDNIYFSNTETEKGIVVTTYRYTGQEYIYTSTAKDKFNINYTCIWIEEGDYYINKNVYNRFLKYFSTEQKGYTYINGQYKVKSIKNTGTPQVYGKFTLGETNYNYLGYDNTGLYLSNITNGNIDIKTYLQINNLIKISGFYNNTEVAKIEAKLEFQTDTYEVIALAPLMMQILSMPWAFISQAFNLTIFPDTPYEINFANLFKGLIAILAVFFIIKLFTSGFNALGSIANNASENAKNFSQAKLNKEKAKETKASTRLKDRTNPNKE